MHRLNESSLEELIVDQMVEGGWTEGAPADFDAAYALDLGHLTTFIEETQPNAAKALSLAESPPGRHKFLARLQGEIARDTEEYNKRPRVKHLGTRVEEYRFAQYFEDWRLKIERVGTLNYPEAAKG